MLHRALRSVLSPVPVGNRDARDEESKIQYCQQPADTARLVLAGDAVYNGIHPFLNESNRQTRPQWLAALDKIGALKPSAVVAGHKIPTNDDSPRNVEETRQYIRDFIRLNDATKTARELYVRMLELYPDRANPGSLWSSAAAAKAES